MSPQPFILKMQNQKLFLLGEFEIISAVLRHNRLPLPLKTDQPRELRQLFCMDKRLNKTSATSTIYYIPLSYFFRAPKPQNCCILQEIASNERIKTNRKSYAETGCCA